MRLSVHLVVVVALSILAAVVLGVAYERVLRERRASRELRRLNAFGQELLEARLDVAAICRLIYTYCQEVAPSPAFAIQMRAPSGALHCPLVLLHGQPLAVSAHECPAPVYDLLERTGQPLVLAAHDGSSPPCDPLPMQGFTASGLYAPIRVNERMLGMIALQSDRPAAFSATQMREVAALAAQAALGMQAAVLLQQRQQRAAQLLLIAEVGRKVAAILDLKTLFHDTVRLVRDTFGYYHVSIYRVSDDGSAVVLAASSDPEIERRGLTLRLGTGLIGHTAQQGESHLANDVLNNALYVHEASLDRTRSELAIPLRVENRILGVLDLQSDAPQAFTQDDASVLQILADQIAVAIEDSQLYMLQRQQSRTSQALLQVANALGGATTSLHECLNTVAEITPRLVEVDWCLVLVWPDSDRAPMLQGAGLDDEALEATGRQLGRRSRDEVTAHWGGQRQLVLQPEDDLAALCPTLAARLPFMVVPLTAREMVSGYLLAGASDAAALDGHTQTLLAGIGRQTSLAIESAMLYRHMLRQQQFEHEMELARDIQVSFMPEALPRVPGWDVAVTWRAARGVGGDFYDFIELDENRLGIVIADVSDKGVAAALYMALSRTVMRSTALEGYSAARTLQRTNALLLPESRSGMFVTMFYGILDVRSGLLRYARAGHNPPLLMRGSDLAVETLLSPGIVLGVVDDPDIEQRTTVLYPGDVLLLYTDGVTEAIAPTGAEFGVDGLQAAMRAAAGQSAEQAIATVSQAQQAHINGSDQHDDFTLLVLRREPVPQIAGRAEA
ncbi:MAG: SpoIIE family protein phosphatase [Anaerolineae bacterium]|jgi:serine phosphatase RsbU (regulator of sigma subunit)/putative methionine-R-sulfoxide reductase with GAF domain